MPIKDEFGSHPTMVLKSVCREDDIFKWIEKDDELGQWQAFKLIEHFNRLAGLPSLEEGAPRRAKDMAARDRRRFG